MSPYVLGQPVLRLFIGVDAVALELSWIGCDAFKQKWHERRLMLLRQLREKVFELFCVMPAIVGWNLHANQQDTRTRLLRQFYHRGQIALSHAQRQAAQGIVAAQFDNDNGRRQPLQHGGKAAQAAAGGVAADAGIIYLVAALLCIEFLGHNRHPARSAL